MTKEELRRHIAGAVIDVISSKEFFETLHQRGLAISMEGCTEGDEPPIDAIDVLIDVRGIERDDPRVVRALDGDIKCADLPVVGFRTLVDGLDASEQIGGERSKIENNFVYVTVGL